MRTLKARVWESEPGQWAASVHGTEDHRYEIVTFLLEGGPFQSLNEAVAWAKQQGVEPNSIKVEPSD
jgi:hypothetical protein